MRHRIFFAVSAMRYVGKNGLNASTPPRAENNTGKAQKCNIVYVTLGFFWKYSTPIN